MSCQNFTCMLLALTSTMLKLEKQHQDLVDKTWSDDYDFIIVGGGTAGCVLARRLSEIKDFRVLMLEVGPAQPVLSELPIYSSIPSITFNYTTVPQEHSGQAFEDRIIPFTKGRVLGGGSDINGRQYNRGSRFDYDNWRDEFGLKDWGYDQVLKYFLKSENNTDNKLVGENSGYHSQRGPWTISSPQRNPVFDKILESIQGLGYPYVDINGRSNYGTTSPQTIVKDNYRQSTATAFLEPIGKRPNLDVVVEAQVTKVLFDGKKAVGVEFLYKNKTTHQVKANREVILSTGTIKSPFLLMLSGVGPKNHIKKYGIKVVADLPGVGKNFHDHIYSALRFDVINQTLLGFEKPDQTVPNLYDLYIKHRGALRELGFVMLNFNTRHSKNKDWPDANFIAYSEFLDNITESSLPYMKRYQKSWQNYLKPYSCRWTLVFLIQVNRPVSRGTIRLKSSSPFDEPLVNPDFLHNSTDLDVLVDAMKTVRQIAWSFRDVIRPFRDPVPGCYCADGFTCRDRRYLECFARQGFDLTLFHIVGSCRMGTADDPDAVVDERLRVRKVKNLRVIDGSVIPQVTSGNTMAPVVMVAEKGADMIKQDYGFGDLNNNFV